jgi:outer membrane lipoprotein-sorting protein
MLSGILKMLKLFLTIIFLMFLSGIADAKQPQLAEDIMPQVSILLGALTAIAFSIGSGMKW